MPLPWASPLWLKVASPPRSEQAPAAWWAAVGAGAVANRPNQVAVGTTNDMVDFPGTVVLHSPNGTAFVLKAANDGMLYTQQLPAYEEPPLLDEGGGG